MKRSLLFISAIALYLSAFSQMDLASVALPESHTEISSSDVKNEFKSNNLIENINISHSNTNNPISYRVDSDLNYLSDREQFYKYAQEIYTNEEWNDASIAFHTYLSESPWILPERTEVYYYLAKLALNQGDYSTSIRLYEKFFIFSSLPNLLDRAEYEYALCHLHDEKLKAVDLFQKIVNNKDHEYYDLALNTIGVIE